MSASESLEIASYLPTRTKTHLIHIIAAWPIVRTNLMLDDTRRPAPEEGRRHLDVCSVTTIDEVDANVFAVCRSGHFNSNPGIAIGHACALTYKDERLNQRYMVCGSLQLNW
jgi:hypothetical protein